MSPIQRPVTAAQWHEDPVTASGMVPRPWHIEATGPMHEWMPAHPDRRERTAEAGDWGSAAVVVEKNPSGFPENMPNWQQRESYRIDIAAGIPTITAATAAGTRHARRALGQLAAHEAIPDLVILDRPAYEWRGLNVDVTRHFFGPEDLVRIMDLMASVSLNRLHLHLSDDQGWRIEIAGFPELTERSSHTSVGGGPGGYLTQQDMEWLGEQATARGIALVPEIDVPGHTTAALHALPGLNPDGAPPAMYEGTEVGISTLSVSAPETERFIDGVFRALAPYGKAGIHIGADECLVTPPEEFAALARMAAQTVRTASRPVVAWQEAAPILDAGEYLQVWDVRQDLTAVAEAAGRGVKIIASPGPRVYLDMKYNADEPLGLTWAGMPELRDSFEWDPRDLVPGVAPESIAGVEACVFTETLETFDELTYMLLPRLAAVAEVAWAGMGVPSQAESDAEAAPALWDSFARRVAGLAQGWTGLAWHRSPGLEWPE